MIPGFTPRGDLPPGLHVAAWDELQERFGYNETRRKQLKGLREVARHLKRAGVRRLYINGSFVTDKPHPNDFDGCYPAEEADMHLLETPLYTHNREDMKARYGGEVFPDVYIPGRGRDPLDFFQSTRARASPRASWSCTWRSCHDPQ